EGEDRPTRKLRGEPSCAPTELPQHPPRRPRSVRCLGLDDFAERQALAAQNPRLQAEAGPQAKARKRLLHRLAGLDASSPEPKARSPRPRLDDASLEPAQKGPQLEARLVL